MVTLDIFDLPGRRVRHLLKELRPAGQHSGRWDGKTDSGRPVAAGVYLARVRVGQHRATVKLTLVE